MYLGETLNWRHIWTGESLGRFLCDIKYKKRKKKIQATDEESFSVEYILDMWHSFWRNCYTDVHLRTNPFR